MHERSRSRLTGGVAACLIAALVAGWIAPSVRAQDGYAIAGEIDGLYPGVEMTLDARVTNPHPFSIRVISTGVTVRDASSRCPASSLEIGDSQATVDVPSGAAALIPLALRMDLGVPDACQGATWPLEFTGAAVGSGVTGLPETSVTHQRTFALLVAIGGWLVAAGLLALVRERRRRRAT